MPRSSTTARWRRRRTWFGTTKITANGISINTDISGRDGAPWLSIDCGGEGLSAYQAHYGAMPQSVFITHVHLDHVGGERADPGVPRAEGVGREVCGAGRQHRREDHGHRVVDAGLPLQRAREPPAQRRPAQHGEHGGRVGARHGRSEHAVVVGGGLVRLHLDR